MCVCIYVYVYTDIMNMLNRKISWFHQPEIASPHSCWKIFFTVSVGLLLDFAERQAILRDRSLWREEGFAYRRNSKPWVFNGFHIDL